MKLIFTSLFCVIIAAQAQQLYGQAYLSSVDIRVPGSLQAVIIDGKPIVYYELHITSFSTDSIALKKLELLDASDSSVIMLVNEGDLMKRFSRIGGYKNNLLLPGSSAIVYIECVLPRVKAELQVLHRLDCERILSNERRRFIVNGANTLITEKFVPVLGPPLKEGPWAAVYDPSWVRGHRRVFYTVNGKARIPGRYAIDFIKLNAEGKYANGNDNLIVNWVGYNSDVFAVADGIVLSTRNDFTESPTLTDHPSHAPEKATGNYVTIDIGNEHIVFYEHLKPGSIKVKPDQHVKKGDIIASLGFTGQTTGPHLHFHVADKNSPLGAEGIPFVFENFILLGYYADLEKFGSEPWTPLKNNTQVKSRERPSPNSVIKFNP